MEKINIKTNRLIIRNLQQDDLNDFHIYRSNSEVMKYQGSDVMDLNACKNFIASQKDKLFGHAGEWVQYGIENQSTKKIIGDCAIKLQLNDIRIAEVGITISHLEQRKGFAKEVLENIAAFLFSKKNVHRIVETVDAENIPSIQLLKSVGFREEGFFIENIFFNGKWGSEFQYAMLKREWKTKNAD